MPIQKYLTFRNYEPGDEKLILELFSLAFRKEMKPAFWRWRYVDNPFGPGIIRMAFDGERLVGHFAAIPFRVSVKGKIYTDVFAMTAMTHPDYGGQGIYTRLMDQTYEIAAKRGVALEYGFCNSNSLGPSLKYGYKNVIRTTLWEKKLNGHETSSPFRGVIEPVGAFDQRADALWDSVKGDFDTINQRNREFLNWRFINSPHSRYSVFVYQDSGTQQGYSVLKVYAEPGTRKGHIVDILTRPDREVARTLIRNACGYFSERGITDLSLWMMGSEFYCRILEEEGFAARPDNTSFGVKVLDPDEPALAGSDDTGRWYITMGDSDVF